MSENPLSVGGSFLIVGIAGWMAGPTIYQIASVHIRGWATLFILLGLAILVKGISQI